MVNNVISGCQFEILVRKHKNDRERDGHPASSVRSIVAF